MGVIILMLVVYFTAQGQTNATGVYSNTTWSLSGSPYIITGTVTVFPGVTLTIQPGVTVSFSTNAQLEIRQAALIALGTSSDSITFTSNGASTTGSWNEINLNGGTMTPKFNYCVFKYATSAIADNRGGSGDTIIIKNSSFYHNSTGIFGQGTSYGIIDSSNFRYNTYAMSTIVNTTINNCDISHNSTGILGSKSFSLNYCSINYNQTAINSLRGCSINNCTIASNQSGIITGSSISNEGLTVKNSTISSNALVGIHISNRGDSVFNCTIINNGIGIYDDNADYTYPTYITKNGIVNNTIGIQIPGTTDIFHCNKICSNTTYDLQYTGESNISFTNNYWCTTDSVATQNVIYDGHNNSSYGLVNFMPVDSACNSTTGISVNEAPDFSFTVFPNPAISSLTIELPKGISKADIKIFNLLGELVCSSTIIKQSIHIDISLWASGIYIIQTTSGANTGKQKFIKQ